MSGPKHTPWTPGPWGYFQADDYGEEFIIDIPSERETARHNTRPWKYRPLATVEGSYEDPETEANAKVMTAAPRLAEELAAWRAWAERWGRDIQTSVSVSPITHNELVERLAATNAALREAGVTDDA